MIWYSNIFNKNDSEAKKGGNEVNESGNIKSPLILNLDGDGIETTGIDDEGKIYFDHNNNSFSESTAWVGADDGLLVRDINNNGQIDSGQELFGDNTVLSTGEKASNGFEALIDLDENADGKIDIADNIYKQLAIWKDSNGNGAVDEGELSSLDAAGVESINLNYSTDGFVDEQGNEHRQISQFTKMDGTVSAINDVWFNTDSVFTVAKEILPETEEIASLPDFKGYGNVYSLHQAMLRDDNLKNLVIEFTNEEITEKRKEILLDIIYTWTGVIDIDPESRACNRSGYGNEIGDARKLEALEEFFGKEFVGTWCWGEKDSNPHGKAAPILLEVFDNWFNLIYSDLMIETHFSKYFEDVWVTEAENKITFDMSMLYDALYDDMTKKDDGGIALLDEFTEVLNNSKLAEKMNMKEMVDYFGSINNDYIMYILGSGKNKITGTDENETLTGTSEDDYILAYDGNDVINAGAGNNIIQSGSGDDTLNSGAGNDTLDGSTGNDTLNGGQGDDAYIFGKGYGKDTIYEYYGNDTIKLKDLNAEDVIFERRRNDNGTNTNDLVIRVKDSENFVTIADHFRYSYRQIEKIEFADGTTWGTYEIQNALRTVNGTETDETLSPTYNSTTIYGYGGNDTLNGTSGTDLLDGGTGDDKLNGNQGDDTYIFAKGYGHDTITEYYGNDKIKFVDILPEDLILTRECKADGTNLYGLEIKIKDSEDSIYIADYFRGAYRQIETFEFSDGTVWTSAEIQNSLRTVNGTDADETLTSTYSRAVINGFDGDDTLNGTSGADVLDGGIGDDILNGGADDDTYIFGGNYGTDTISDTSGNDTIFADFSAEQLVFSRNENSSLSQRLCKPLN